MSSYDCICGKSLRSSSGLYKHRRQCSVHIASHKYESLVNDFERAKGCIEDMQKTIDELKDTNMQLQLDNKESVLEMKNTIKELRNENKQLSNKLFGTITKQLDAKDRQIEGAGNIIGTQNKSIIQMLRSHAANAPVLEYIISDETIQEQIKGNDKGNIGMIILNHFTEGDLHSVLGDVLVANYQEDDIKKQSLWTTDVARLTYLIKDITTKGDSIWTQDKKGNKVKQMIIKPLLLKVKGIIETFYKAIMKAPTTTFRLRIEDEAIKLLHEIGYKGGKNTSILASKINTYIAGHMHFEEKHKKKLGD